MFPLNKPCFPGFARNEVGVFPACSVVVEKKTEGASELKLGGAEMHAAHTLAAWHARKRGHGRGIPMFLVSKYGFPEMEICTPK